MRTDTFELEGVTYYAEGRKCGKAGCRCQTGDLHGPYWYRRDRATGKVDYLGKALPDHVEDARRRLTYFSRDIEVARRRLVAQAEALGRLYNRRTLTREDRVAIRDLGFGLCLVSEPLNAHTQETMKEPRP